MPYFPLPDEFHSAPDFLGLSDAAVALYAKAASWSACHLTDGHVPTTALPLLANAYEQGSAELVDKRVWRRSRGGFQFVHWPNEVTRSYVEAKREAAKRRQQKHRSSQEESSRCDEHVTYTVTHGVTNGVSHSAQSSPHQGETPNGVSRGSARTPARATRLPEDFAITDAMRAWGTDHAPGVDLDYETDKFRDYWQAQSGQRGTKRDWPGTWRNWIRRAHENAQRFRPHSTHQPQQRMSTRDQRVAETQRLKAQMLGDSGDDDGPQLRAISGGTS